MKEIKRILRRIWRIWFAAVFIVHLIILYPFFRLSLMREFTYIYTIMLKKMMIASVFFLSGISGSLRGGSLLQRNATYIFCPNHTSYLDIIMLYHVLPHFMLFMGKSELLKVPLFNIFFQKMHIVVDRSSKLSSHRAFVRAKDELDKGHSLVIFPEGKIPSNVPVLNIFKNGPFRLAIEKKIPVVPVTFLHNWKILPSGRAARVYGGPRKSVVVIHEPIPTGGMTEDDLVNLRDRVFQTIYNSLKEDKDRTLKNH